MRTVLGTMTDPNTCWLLMRSLETLKIRMEEAQKCRRGCRVLISASKVEKYTMGLLLIKIPANCPYSSDIAGNVTMLV
jgi:methionine-gamma-lyase